MLTMVLASGGGAGRVMGEEYQGAPMPRVYAPVRSRSVYGAYPWHERIATTIFWIGESPTANNPTPNNKSSWDPKWETNFGGFDDPNPANRTWDFCPKGFQPGQNPFYIALPYNDVLNSWTTKPETRRVIPWFKQKYVRSGRSVCKGQWLAIRFGKKVCYAQWEDCGPFNTEDHGYVFGRRRPKNRSNGGAGLDVSPAVRDYMKIRSGAACDWRFVSVGEVPDGPWRRYGANNDFVLAKKRQAAGQLERMEELRQQRERWLKQQRPGS
ncbi:MAG: hypothetical protein P8J87_10095 [Verrucomicrobiales bacterium]|nr:hypothetical protein [Verrucomicrobiales bacterium]